MLFFILLAILILAGILIVFLKYKEAKNKSLIYIFSLIYAVALFFIPFLDPLQVPGFWASVILQNSDPTLYGFIVGLLVINCGIYGIHIFLSSANLVRAERYRGRLITTGQFSKRRFPLYASYHLIGLSYLILMGTITGVIFLSFMTIFLFLDTSHIEENRLIPKYKDEYHRYKKKIPKRMYSTELLFILIIEYILFLIGIIFAFTNI
jgi:protein-S-isoprenylcysteine O-methyltransferase Ste14